MTVVLQEKNTFISIKNQVLFLINAPWQNTSMCKFVAILAKYAGSLIATKWVCTPRLIFNMKCPSQLGKMTQITHGRGKYQTLMKFVKFFLKQSNFHETRNSSVTQSPLELEPTISRYLPSVLTTKPREWDAFYLMVWLQDTAKIDKFCSDEDRTHAR